MCCLAVKELKHLFFCAAGSAETGVLSSFYSYFALTDTPQQRGPSAEDQEAIQRAQDCIQECHVEQLIMESKFLRVDSLQELLKVDSFTCYNSSDLHPEERN